MNYVKTCIITVIAAALAWGITTPPLLSFFLIAAAMVIYLYGWQKSLIPVITAVVFAAVTATPYEFLTRLPFLVALVGITALVGYIKSLNFKLRTLAWVVNSSTDAIISKKFDGTIETWSHGAEVMLGWKESEVLGHDIKLTIPPDLYAEEDFLRKETQKGHIVHLETSRLTKWGHAINVELSSFPVKNQYGHIVGITTVMRDLTATKQAISMAEAQFRGTPIPIFSWKRVGDDFELVDFNKAGLTITEGKIGAILGIKASELYKERPEVIEQMNAAYDSRSTIRKEGPFTFVTTGKEYYVDASFVFVPPDVVMIHAEDITARRNNEAVVRRSQEQFRTIVENAPNGLVVINKEGLITMVNVHLEKLFGYERQELIGHPVEMLIPQSLAPLHRMEREDFMRHPATRPVNRNKDLFGKRKDGSLFPVEIGLSPIETSDGPLVLGTVVDVTERKKYEQDIKEAKDEAERASKAKDEFLAVISHELKTPLSSILGYSSLLTSGRLGEISPSAMVALTTIERSARSQATLIEDLLDISRIVSGKIKIKQLIVGISGIVHHVFEQFKLAAAEKGITLECDDCKEKLFVQGDPGRLQQILTNLVDNAVKFTPKGGTVTIKIKPNALTVHIIVTDTGIGIEPLFMKELFQRFKQESTGIRRIGQGLGLGLSIAKSLAELQHGTITANSEGRGKGATFTVTFPLSSPPLEESAVSNINQPVIKQSLDGLAVLIVDDDRDTLEMLKVALEKFGAATVLAESAEEGRTKLEQNEIDVIVCDIGMPVVSGYEFIRALRDERRTIPALALTAFSGEEYAKMALDAGFTHYMSKPIEINKLVEGLVHTLELVDKS